MLATRFGPVRCLVQPAEPGRTTALLVHGIGARAEVWEPVLRLFQSLRPVAIDLPGHGGSSGALLASAEECAACLEDVRLGLGLPDAVAIGQSLGGAVVQCWAALFQQSCRGIVIANSAARYAIAAQRLLQVEADWPAAAADFAARQLSPHADPALRREAERLVALRPPAVLAHDLRICNAFDAQRWAAAVKAPVLVLTGDEDVSAGPERARELHALYPHSQLAVLERCGHNAVLEQPAAFAAAVDAFARAQLASITSLPTRNASSVAGKPQ